MSAESQQRIKSEQVGEMPRYFFNLAPGHPIDVEGEELSDDDAARDVAHQTAQEILRDGPPIPGERLLVSNEMGELVTEVYLDEYAAEHRT